MARLRVLVSAFACWPGRGSEQGVGWTWARAAAQVADVWLLTERENQGAVEQALAAEPDLPLRPVYVDLPAPLRTLSSGGQRIRLRHAAWQVAAHRAVAGLLPELRPDVLHHLTWSADWQPVGLPRPAGTGFVWGPVGGTAPVPWPLRRWFSPRSAAGEAARFAAGAVGRRAFGDAVARRSDVLLCLNRDVQARFAGSTRAHVVLEPNVGLDRAELDAIGTGGRRERTAVFAGRLQDWKGLRLAVATLASPEADGWRLRVVGEGPGRVGAQELAGRLGVQDRVDWLGQLSRTQTLQELASASALLQPSMHDACGWAVAEALALGTPAVVLDVGGPPLLLERAGAGAGTAVPVSTDPTPALAAALRRTEPRPRSRAFDADRLPALLADVYARASRSS